MDKILKTIDKSKIEECKDDFLNLFHQKDIHERSCLDICQSANFFRSSSILNKYLSMFST
jgi:hypothetical protein